MPSLRVVHLELAWANEFVDRVHRHHDPATGHRFSIGALKEDQLVGVAIIGRPVARLTDQIWTVEVIRLATDGTRNACSFLYGAAARAAIDLGYCKIQTFILDSEPGTSLKAAGWEFLGYSEGGRHARKGRPRKDTHPLERKQKWGRDLLVNCWEYANDNA